MKMAGIYQENALCTVVQQLKSQKEETLLNGCLVDVFWHHGKFGGLVPSPRFRRVVQHAVINLWDHRSQSSQCLRTVPDFSMLILRKFDFVFWLSLFFQLYCRRRHFLVNMRDRVLNLCWWLLHTEGAQLGTLNLCVSNSWFSSAEHANQDQSREPHTVSVNL